VKSGGVWTRGGAGYCGDVLTMSALALDGAAGVAVGVAVVINIVIDDDKCCRLLGVDI